MSLLLFRRLLRTADQLFDRVLAREAKKETVRAMFRKGKEAAKTRSQIVDAIGVADHQLTMLETQLSSSRERERSKEQG